MGSYTFLWWINYAPVGFMWVYNNNYIGNHNWLGPSFVRLNVRHDRPLSLPRSVWMTYISHTANHTRQHINYIIRRPSKRIEQGKLPGLHHLCFRWRPISRLYACSRSGSQYPHCFKDECGNARNSLRGKLVEAFVYQCHTWCWQMWNG